MSDHLLGYIPLFFGAVAAQLTIPIPITLGALGLIKLHFDPILVFSVTIIGLSVGAMTDYFFARYGIDTIPFLRKKHHSRGFKHAEKIYRRFGKKAILLSFAPLIGPYFPYLAGSMETPFWAFLLMFLISRGVYYGAILLGLKYFSLIS